MRCVCGLVSGLVVLRVRVKQRPERTSDRASADAMLVVGERINGVALLQGFQGFARGRRNRVLTARLAISQR